MPAGLPLAQRGEEGAPSGSGAVLQRTPKAKAAGLSRDRGAERSGAAPSRRAQPSWKAQPSRLPGAIPGWQDTVSPHSLALTVVGEARFAQTHDKVHFHLVRSHRFGANGALETWKESREMSP